MKIKKYVFGLMVISVMSSAHAGILAAWDVNTNANTTSTGWTTFAYGLNATDTVNFTGDAYLGDGSITLTQTSATDTSFDGNRVYTFNTAAPLLAAGDDVFGDAQRIDLYDPQTYTLSGLEVNQEYRIQFLGMILSKNGGDLGARNMSLTVGASTVNLFTGSETTAGEKDELFGYSEYLTFTATGTSETLSFAAVSAGNRALSGVIVEAIPEPATLGMIAAFGGGILFLRRRMML